MSDLVPVRRALLSVSDKTGLEEFANAMVNEFGIELLSAGETTKFLRAIGLAVTDAGEVARLPERVDLVCVNLHPFEKAIQKSNGMLDEAIGQIDIDGPNLIRSAAKSHRTVIVVTDPSRYDKVLGDLREHGGRTCGKHRLRQAQRAFAYTAEYDSEIASFLRGYAFTESN
ncbi:MAG TPA: hypothetical protein PK402_06825 [Tepidisphaeraceae bacterium]|nr:hypothetical protein [Tepidisphaeraceae bacterium]